jgi:hypothetical protein
MPLAVHVAGLFTILLSVSTVVAKDTRRRNVELPIVDLGYSVHQASFNVRYDPKSVLLHLSH